MKRMKFLLENKWINFLPIKAPKRAPNEMQPVMIPVATCKLNETLKTVMISEN